MIRLKPYSKSPSCWRGSFKLNVSLTPTIAAMFLGLLLINSAAIAQSISATYNTGDISSEFQAGAVDTSMNSACSALLTVNVPVGQYVTSVDIEYDMEALGGAWMSEQSSYVECVTTNTKESTVSFGPPTNTGGTQSYNRTGVAIANGLAPVGGLQFRIHAFRSWGGAACNTNFQRIVNNTFKITAHYGPAPTCFPPTNVQVSNITATSADVDWTTGGATAWQLEYGPAGFTPGTGTLVSVTTKPHNISGLLASTAYDVYVRDSCGPADVSTFTGPINFATPCSSVLAPYTESFNTVGALPLCWSTAATNGGPWLFGGNPNSVNCVIPPDHTGNSGSYAWMDQSGVDAAVILQMVDVDVSPLTVPYLDFYYWMCGVGYTPPNELHIETWNGTSWVLLASITTSTAGWENYGYSLAGRTFATNMVRVRFRAESGGSPQDFFGDNVLDDIGIIEAPTCPQPTLLAASNPTATSVDLSWTTGGATNWQVEYGATGFTLGTGTVVSASTNPFTLTGLNSSTTYDFYVRDSCGPSDVSSWVGPVTLGTLCLPVTAPWVENFDGANFVPGTGGFPPDIGTIDNCWSRTPITDYVWQAGPPAFANPFTGPSVDHTTGLATGGYVFLNSLTGNLTTGTFLETPQIDLSSLTVPELSFWYHMFGPNIGSLEVEIDNGSGYTNLQTITGQQQTTENDAWIESIISLSAYANDTVRLRFRGIKPLFGFQAEIAVDDVDIHEAPTCPKPSALISTTQATTSITLSWTTGGATNWQIEYGVTGFTPGTGTIVNAGTNPFTVTGLNPSTTYDLYVRDSCGATDLSAWFGPATASTLCAPVAAPWVENFDGANFVPGTGGFPPNIGTIDNCWSRTPITDYVWQAGPPPFANPFTGPNVDHTTGLATGGYAYTNSLTGTPTLGTFLETPQIDLSTLTVPELSFWYHMFGLNIGSLEVEIDNGSGFTNLTTITGQQQTAETDAWLESIISLSAYANDTIRLRFRGVKPAFGFQAEIAVDDVDIHEAPSCPQPSNLANTIKTANSVTLTWTTGGATNWQIEYGLTGYTQGTGTLVNASTNPFTVTGLSPQTAYDFYVRDSCGVADVSKWIGPITVVTDCSLLTAPHTENFDGVLWTSGVGFDNNGNAISPCWSRPSANNPNFGTRTGPTTSVTTGPAADFSGTGNYLFTEASGGALGTGEITSPKIVVDASIVNPQVSFWYHMYGANIDSLQVQMSVNNGPYVRMMSLVGQDQTANADPWKEAFFNIAANSGDTIQVRFLGTNNGFNGDIAIDEFTVGPAPSCPAPTGLTVNSVGVTTVTLAWTTGGASNWQVEYGPTGFTPGTGTIVAASTNPFVVTGLTSATTYDFYVRDSCGVADVSNWIGSVTATTTCVPIAAPWSENFDGATFVPSTGGFPPDNGSIDPCWSRNPLTDYVWQAGPPPFANPGTGPLVDHTTSSATGGYAFIASNTGTAVTGTDLVTPAIDLSALTVPELTFWYHMWGFNIGSLEVEIDNGSGFVNLQTITGQQQTAETDAWIESVLSLAAYANDTVRIKFKGVKPLFGFQAEIAVDDVDIHETPTCPKPSLLASSLQTATTIVINWTGGGAANWDVRYRPSGSTVPYTVISNVTNPYIITGLSPSTNYDIYVRDSCGTGDVSVWVGPLTERTDCGVITAPYVENFNSNQWVAGLGVQNINDQIDDCWSRPSAIGHKWGTGPRLGSSANTGPDAGFGGTGNFIHVEASNGDGTAEITTPQIFIPNSMSSPWLYFHYHMFGINITSLAVQINDGSGWSANLKTITGAQHTSGIDPWDLDSLDLSAYTGDTIQIKFLGAEAGGFQGDIAVDEIAVRNATICGDPTALTFTNITPLSVDVSWTSTGANSQLMYQDQAKAQPPVFVNNAVSPYTITSLQPNTTYDVFVRDSCGVGSVGNYITDTVTTLICPPITAGFSSSSSWLSVNFNSGATTNADSIHWDFGDGKDTSLLNPQHLYDTAGVYAVTLSAFSDCGSTGTFIDTIRVCDTLKADFAYTQLGGDTINFDASGSSNAVFYKWNFNGVIETGMNVDYIFPTPGTKPVTLTVYNLCGDSAQFTQNVQVCLKPVASWTYNVISTTSNGMLTQFDGSASQNAASYEWDFGDGSPVVTGQVMPQHNYITPGFFYQVTLTVTNTCGDQSVSTFRLNQVGIDELDLIAAIKVYPNPATDVLTLEWNINELDIDQIELVETTGKVVLRIQDPDGAEGESRLNVNQLAPGYYTLRVYSSGRVIQKKVVIR